MKKTVNVLLWTLIGLALLVPCGKLLCLPFGYNFELVYAEPFTFIIAFLTVCTTGFLWRFKIQIDNKAQQIFAEILTPLSFVNSVLFILVSQSPFVIGNCAIYIISSFILVSKIESPIPLQIISIILSVLMIYPVSVFEIAAFLGGNFVEINVVETVDSPNGKYRAEVISSDQGALGGDTFVEVYRKGIDAFIFKITGKPERVYWGDWMEYVDLDIYWKDENRLIIGSHEHFFD